MRTALAICGGSDYTDSKRIRVEAQLIRVVTPGGFGQKPISQAAIILPPLTQQQLLDEIEDSFMLDESDIFQIHRSGVASAWVIYFSRATDKSLDLIAEYLGKRPEISRVYRYVYTNSRLKETLGFEPPTPKPVN